MKILLTFLIIHFSICNEKINVSKFTNMNLINTGNYSNYTQNNKKKNAILGIIEKYPLSVVLPFFKSLIFANLNNCDIIMFVRYVSQTLINYLKSIRVIVYEISEEFKNVSVINLRWKMYIDFLQINKDKYNLVFSTDIRDTIFQKDIFQNYKFYKPFLGIAIEDGTLNNEFNKKWIIDFVGIEKFKKIQNERIICVGTIWGSLELVLKFSIIFWEKLIANVNCIEQGIGNYLFYYEKILKDYLIKSDNYGPVMTIGLTERNNIILDKNFNILNFRGEIASVIHQYNRKNDIKIKLLNKYCPEIFYLNNTETYQLNLSAFNLSNKYNNSLYHEQINVNYDFYRNNSYIK